MVTVAVIGEITTMKGTEVEDHGHVPPGAQMAAAVINKAVIVNVRATAHDHLRDHPCHHPSRSTEGVRRRGGSRSRPPRRRNGSSCGEQSRHSQRESDRPRSPSRSPLPPPSRSTEGVRRRGGSRSRPPIRRNGSSLGQQSRHSQLTFCIVCHPCC
ncbi:unnamed protein product [Porites lobata]|uniref:Uncharacterized protein n=1 Tax=Porites lobata TaxID=104759 RepID=A0ABN8QFQ5_9CNID|nr:unnamed protein product [Porites lobata]